MIPDGYFPPVRNTEDIPIQRSVTAMGLNHTEPEFKPYRYRGWDIDLFEGLPPIHRLAPRAQPAPQPRSRPRRRRVAPSPSLDLLVAEAAAHEAQASLATFEAGISQPKKKKKKDKHVKPRPTIPTLPRKPARSARGWKPLTGADLEDAWALLEEDE